MGEVTGRVLKLKSTHISPIEYHLPIGDTLLPLNPYLGKTLTLHFTGRIQCLGCDQLIKKSYGQGYCYVCTQTLARCDLCIVRPEKCHFHLGTCREPTWGETHCFIPHIIYLANTSGLKVGITRETQIPTRWIDQGATQALPILKVKNRYHSGLVEVMLKQHVNDKTHWRKMLQGGIDAMDLKAKRDELFRQCKIDFTIAEHLANAESFSFQYPVLEYPAKVTSLNLDKTPTISGTLLGIKGQYLLFDMGVINIRNISGYELKIKSLLK